MILDLLNKPNTPGHCGFPQANLHQGPSIYCVPQSNSDNLLILLCICSANLKFVCPIFEIVGSRHNEIIFIPKTP